MIDLIGEILSHLEHFKPCWYFTLSWKLPELGKRIYGSHVLGPVNPEEICVGRRTRVQNSCNFQVGNCKVGKIPVQIPKTCCKLVCLKIKQLLHDICALHVTTCFHLASAFCNATGPSVVQVPGLGDYLSKRQWQQVWPDLQWECPCGRWGMVQTAAELMTGSTIWSSHSY